MSTSLTKCRQSYRWMGIQIAGISTDSGQQAELLKAPTVGTLRLQCLHLRFLNQPRHCLINSSLSLLCCLYIWDQ